MANFSDLPTEIWHLIAQYLPASQLFKLKSLNSFFLNYYMDLEWKKFNVHIDNIDPKGPYHFLRRLELPFVAPRTKMVSVTLVTSQLTGTGADINFAGSLGCLLHSLNLLPNLTCLDIHDATFHLFCFFKTITSSSLRKTLQELLLAGQVGMFASIQEYCTHKSPFDNLKKFTLELYASYDDEDPQLESSLALEYFLRSLAPTLQSLKITSRSSTLDLSPLFDALSKTDSPVLFSNLISFSLCLHFNTSFRTSPQSLRHFLRTNNHLQHLQLDMSLSLPDPEDEEPLGAWLADLVNDNIHFPCLQTLDIYPSNTKTGLSAFLGLIKLTGPTLTSLIVSSRWLKSGMVNDVIDTLKECEGQPKLLKSLTLNIVKLSVPILELLARKLPNLEKLTLSPIRFVGSGKDTFHDLLRKRDSSSTQDVFHAWKLQDLKIYVESDWDDDDDLDENAIRAVAGAVPSLAHLRVQDMDDKIKDSDEEF